MASNETTKKVRPLGDHHGRSGRHGSLHEFEAGLEVEDAICTKAVYCVAPDHTIAVTERDPARVEGSTNGVR